MSRRARKRRAAPKQVLAPEWRRWVAENLAGGAAPDTVRAALESKGVPAAEAGRAIDEVLASPLLPLLLEARRRAERYGQVLRLLRQQLDTRAAPGAVERVAGLDADTFFERYYATSTPVVWTDFMAGWPALERWAPAKLAAAYGDVEVEVCEGRDADPDYDLRAGELTATTTLRTLVERIDAAVEGSNDFYMIARNRNLEGALRPLLDDVRDETGVLDGSGLVGASQLWLGPAGTVTPLHHDTSNILFCQVWGEKRVLLASPVERALLQNPRAMYARGDPEDGLEGVQLREVTLTPGDALFIPVGWWHHVRALTASVSIAFVAFTRNNDCRWYTPGKL